MSQAFGKIGEAGASLFSGFAKAKALNTEAAQLERVRRDEQVKAKQISAIRREQVDQALSTIDAIRASRGLDIDSAGGMAIRKSNRRAGRINENAEVLSSKNRQEDLKVQAAMKRRAAPFALLAAGAQAGASLAEAFAPKESGGS